MLRADAGLLDVFSADGGVSAPDARQQSQFRHRRACFDAARAVRPAWDWVVVLRPDFVYFESLLASNGDSRSWPFSADVSTRVFRVETSCRQLRAAPAAHAGPVLRRALSVRRRGAGDGSCAWVAPVPALPPCSRRAEFRPFMFTNFDG